ncbi:MAG TPA: glycosyltransferase family 39 protein [Caproiciproducens sp.]|nr:glycosyltransferase family 39 protein [Caproiciproducens sp.]
MQRKLKDNYHILMLIGIAILSFTLNFYAISNNGTGNEYYAACVKSMTQSWKNFFFVSFDPSGMVSVDKPPLGLWVQAIFVLIFGYHGWVLLLPQALAGTASCILIYLLTARSFGRPAGLVSSLIFAVTPAVVVVSRNNTMDMQLVFVLLIATWFLFRAIERAKWRWLFLAALFIGLGFNIKMLQAYMILPAVAVTYLIFAKEKFAKRLLAGILSMVIMAVVSFAWVAVVELTPASDRPYVDSTSGNSMLELIMGHNGTERLFGSGMGGGSVKMDGSRTDRFDGGSNPDGFSGASPNGTPPQMNGENLGAPPQDSGASAEMLPKGNRDGRSGSRDDGLRGENRQNGMGGGIGGSEIGSASAVRLWTSNLFGQSSWFLLFALLAIFGCFHKASFRKKEMSQAALLYWSIWLVTMFVFFSFAGFYHRYYLCMAAPAIAVLSGVGIVTMYLGFKYRKESWKKYIRPVFLAVSLLANIALQVYYLLNYDSVKTWLLPVIGIAGTIGIAALAAYLIRSKHAALLLATAALTISALAAPFYWAVTPVMYVPNATMPYAGPELAGNIGFGADRREDGTGSRSRSNALEQYLVRNYKQGSFLVVSQRSSDIAQLIIDTGLPCYAYGGFLGSDHSLTLDQLKRYVAEGKVTYFLLSGQGGGNEKSEITTYVKEHAKLINSSEYGSANANVGQMSPAGGTLYLFQ